MHSLDKVYEKYLKLQESACRSVSCAQKIESKHWIEINATATLIEYLIVLHISHFCILDKCFTFLRIQIVPVIQLTFIPH